MSRITLREASTRELAEWDDQVARSANGTLFHTRAFLGYHGERFRDTEAWLVALDGGSIEALISYSAHQEGDGTRVALSPYGASYGGFVLTDAPSYDSASGLVDAFCDHLLARGLSGFRLTHPIACCSEANLDTLVFAMLERGARSVNRDISSVVPLRPGGVEAAVSSRARRNARKARSLGVRVAMDAPLDDFWVPMEATFAKHGTAPTHDRAQLEVLLSRAAGRIRLHVAYLDETPVASVGLFTICQNVVCSFYLCQTPAGAEAQALTLLLLESMERAAAGGYRYFDLGTSSVGMRARANVFRFKDGFLAQGYFRETLEWRAPLG